MNDVDSLEPRTWRERIFPTLVIFVIILVICLNDSCRERLHRLYNMIPPRRAKLTIALQSGEDDFLNNQMLVFDGRDSLTTDIDGEVIVDDLPVGKHNYSILYGDSLHRYTVNLQHDSLITVTVHMQGNDVVKGVVEQTGRQGALAPVSQSGKVTLFGSQWFTQGNSVQFGPVMVKLDKMNRADNNIYVTICHTKTNFVCETTITGNNLLSRDSWIRFTDGGYDYKLILERIDMIPQDPKNPAALVSLTQTIR